MPCNGGESGLFCTMERIDMEFCKPMNQEQTHETLGKQTRIRRILCIDGGGIKGTLPAAFLKALEDDLRKPVGSYFDLIAGTSTGGIIALGLSMGRSAEELLALYEKHGPVIFGQDNAKGPPRDWLSMKIWKFKEFCRHVVKPKHDADILARVLDSVLDGAHIGDARTRLVIPAWDPDRRSPYLYKTSHHPRLTTDYRKAALDAALATAAAPTYFKRHRTADDVGLTDGGTWANNPTAIAVVEAISILGWSPAELRVLSLGCSDEGYMLPEAPGLAQLNRQVLYLYADGQSHGALGMAKLLLNHPYDGERLYRYSPKVPQGFFSLDDTSKICRLKGLGASEARNAKPHLSPVFFQEPAEPFVPFHCLTEDTE